MIRLHPCSTLFLLLLAGSLAICNFFESKANAAPATGSEILWLTNYNVALQQAQATKKLVVVDFFATWCVPCKMMERDTLSDKQVQQRLSNFVPLKIDVDLQPSLAAKYGIEAMPTTLIVDANGKPSIGVMGYQTPDDYESFLDAARTNNVEHR